MKKYYILFFIYFLLKPIDLLSQYNNCDCTINKDYIKDVDDMLTGRYYTNLYAKKELQYFNYWESGEAILNNGNVVKDIYLRYNAFLDELIWLRKSDYKTAIVDKEFIKGFRINDLNEKTSYFEFEKIALKNWVTGDSVDVYLQILSKGQISFYAQRRVVHIRTNDEFYRKDIYYIFKKGIPYKVDLRRQSLLRILSEDKEAIKPILRKQRLRVRKEKDFAKAIFLYNKLLEKK